MFDSIVVVHSRQAGFGCFAYTQTVSEDSVMTLPNWKTYDGGTKVRIALWLHDVVGPGGVFTKAQLRAAFPNVEQVDRRMRDLRPEGWVIHTNTQDVTLDPEELRLVKVGGRVWEKAYRSAATSAVSESERRAVMLRDNYACVFCGISAGEGYFDESSRTAVLGVIRSNASSGRASLVTSCARCRAAAGGTVSASDVQHQIQELCPEDANTFLQWAARGRKPKSALDMAWLSYLRLPADIRKEVLQKITSDNIGSLARKR